MQLEWIRWLQAMGSPFWDSFFKLLNFFDRPEFFFILIPLVWYGHSWKRGLSLFYLVLLSGLANMILKDVFLLPRPFHLDPSLGLISVGGYGFPSGAAQTVVLLSGLILTLWKNAWKWIVALAYAFFVSLSRVYLGVHFPTDILGGWLVGLLIWLAYAYGHPPLERRLEQQRLEILLLISQLVPLAFLLCNTSFGAIRLCALGMGIGWGLFLNHKWGIVLEKSHDFKESLQRSCMGIVGTFAFYALTLLIPFRDSKYVYFAQFFLLGIWVCTGCAWLCQKMSMTKSFRKI